MQEDTKRRRRPGHRQAPGATRKEIIRYLFEQESGTSTEPDIRDCLRERCRISDSTGIRDRLRELEKEGLINKDDSRGKGLENVWSLQRTNQLLIWCHQHFDAHEFVTIYRSPVGSQIVADQPIQGLEYGMPMHEGAREQLIKLNEWARRAILVSPSVWQCFSVGSTASVTAIYLLIKEFSSMAGLVHNPKAPPPFGRRPLERSTEETNYIKATSSAEQICSIYLSCMVLDAVMYTNAVSAEILGLLRSDELKASFSPVLLDNLCEMVVKARLRTVAIKSGLALPIGAKLYTPSINEKGERIVSMNGILLQDVARDEIDPDS